MMRVIYGFGALVLVFTSLLLIAPDAHAQTVRTFTLYLNDYGFNATRGGPTLMVDQGDTVRIRLIGNGSGPIVHDFTLDANSPSPYDVRSRRLSRGQEQVIEFVANYPGEFKYYCSVAPPFGQSHRERGQEATIVVRPKETSTVTWTERMDTVTLTTTIALTMGGVTATTAQQGDASTLIILVAAVLVAALGGSVAWALRRRSRR